MGLDIESLLVSPQRPRVLVTACASPQTVFWNFQHGYMMLYYHKEEEQKAALQMIRGGAKRRPRNERNIQKPADDSSMAEKRARLAEAKKDLEDAKKLEHTMVLEEATCAAEIDEEAPSVSTANFRPSQAVRTEQDTEAVLNSWASSPDAQECPDILHMIEDDGPFDALEKLEECIQMFKPNLYEPIPKVACRMLFELVFKGCPRGCSQALKILKQVIDKSCPKRIDGSCLSPSEPKHSNKLNSSLDWVPSDAEFLQALKDLGYVAPEDPEQLPLDAPKEHVPMHERLFGQAKQWHFEMQQHPNESNVIAVCVAMVLLSDAFLKHFKCNVLPPREVCAALDHHPETDITRCACHCTSADEELLQSTLPEPNVATPRTPTAAPPFGRSPDLVTALARLHNDRCLTIRTSRRYTRAALDALLALGTDNHAWGTDMALQIPTLMKRLPSSQAASLMCFTFAGSERAIHVQQAAAAHALLALHGRSEAVSITNVFEVPVKEVIQQLGTAQEIFARMTPSDDSTGGKPAGWEVLTTMELLFQVVEPQKYAFMKAALNGQAIGRGNSLLSLVEPIARGVEKGLKKRQSVSVMRTRLLCTAIVDTLRESEATINETARASLRGKTVIIDD